MTKCGKSFLPECEYFATNGCVSPFNCPYKIENESITTATSTPCNHYPLETDKDKEISRLQAENAELCHRAEVAESALLTACVNLIKDVEDNVDMELLAHVVYTKFLRKAEKELSEEI